MNKLHVHLFEGNRDISDSTSPRVTGLEKKDLWTINKKF